MSKMFLCEADHLWSDLIVHGFPQFASARVSSWAVDAVDEVMASLYPSAPSPADPWTRVWSERN